jgi:formate-dependent nitrite reductase membrane component NrfD
VSDADHDLQPALGARGGPASWTPAQPGAAVELARPDFGDARWSYLYKSRDTGYADAEPAPGQVAEANRRMRDAPVSDIRGPFIHPPLWGWEVATYFWLGGTAAGSAFVALACDAAGDHRSAAIARKVALGAVAPAPLLLVADLGRPERFLNMTRIFKPRSPMNTGSWCLVAFSGSSGSYLGSYTGVLLACTAVPLWSGSRTILGPAFVATATATGAAATRLVLVASGLPQGHPTRRALGAMETTAMLTELSISALGERRLGDTANALSRGRPGLYFRTAKSLVVLGLALRLLARRTGPREHELASFMYLAAGLLFRFTWVYAGRASARDDDVVAAMARDQSRPQDDQSQVSERRAMSVRRSPLPLPGVVRRAYGEAIRLTSLAIERRVRRVPR